MLCTRLWCIPCRHCAGLLVLLLGFRIRVRGYQNFARAEKLGAICTFNHSSWVDAMLIMWLFAPSGVSKADNADIPLVGTCIKAYQNIYVPRSSIDRNRAAKDFKSRDARYPMLAMAPEGTCGDGRCLLQFKTGAFVPGQPILPVLLTYNKRHHNPAWTIINEGWHFLRVCCQFENAANVEILEPYMPSTAEKQDAALFAKNVRQLYGRILGLPLVEQVCCSPIA
eukprot:jgi/Astpho2/8361/e_gw1.00122.122.1_t